MKIIRTLIALFLIQHFATAQEVNFMNLVEVNRAWLHQEDIDYHTLSNIVATTESEWIQAHLERVEQVLRKRSVKGLNSKQLSKRLVNLDQLHIYSKAAQFPINDFRPFRTPVFIDRYNNFCAVGYMIKTSGHESLSRHISSHSNLAYVENMQYPELLDWAKENGFTVDELAWIQPSYPPQTKCIPIGKGVDGFINELFVDKESNRMYVGGHFSTVDQSIHSPNIAYVTEEASGYKWHEISGGVRGDVKTIIKYKDDIFVGGHFDRAGAGLPCSNIAIWNGAGWKTAGCLDGTINDFILLKDTLYAAGSFRDCADLEEGNFARWDGRDWHLIKGLNGVINVMELVRDTIVLGGRFDWSSELEQNVIKWTSQHSFWGYQNKIMNEVKDLRVINDTLHASCVLTHVIDSPINLVQQLNENTWSSFFKKKMSYALFWSRSSMPISFNTLYGGTSGINIGGYFLGLNGMSLVKNTLGLGALYAIVDSAVFKIASFNGALILGGTFKTGMNSNPYTSYSVELNGITKVERWSAGIMSQNAIPQRVQVFPNPVRLGQKVFVEPNEQFRTYTLTGLMGQQLCSGFLPNSGELNIPELEAGLYWLSLVRGDGTIVGTQIVLEP